MVATETSRGDFTRSLAWDAEFSAARFTDAFENLAPLQITLQEGAYPTPGGFPCQRISLLNVITGETLRRTARTLAIVDTVAKRIARR